MKKIIDMETTVGVVITSYNSEKFIERAIYSVLGQSQHFKEIIIVDHASTDSTFERIERICDSYQKKTVFKVCRMEHNFGGPAWPRNLGLRLCESEFVCFLDADDMCCHQRAEKLMEHCKGGADLVIHAYTNIYDIKDDRNMIKEVSRSRSPLRSSSQVNRTELLSDLLDEGMTSCVGSYAVRMDKAKTISFRENAKLIGSEDMVFLLDYIGNQELSVVYESQELIYYYIGTLESKHSRKSSRQTLTNRYRTISQIDEIYRVLKEKQIFVKSNRLRFSKHYAMLLNRQYRVILKELRSMQLPNLLIYLASILKYILNPKFKNKMKPANFITISKPN
jgi:glycosyltransferase involved in cell wall biosynthesis